MQPYVYIFQFSIEDFISLLESGFGYVSYYKGRKVLRKRK